MEGIEWGRSPSSARCAGAEEDFISTSSRRTEVANVTIPFRRVCLGLTRPPLIHWADACPSYIRPELWRVSPIVLPDGWQSCPDVGCGAMTNH